jgi:hypothetical protein
MLSSLGKLFSLLLIVSFVNSMIFYQLSVPESIEKDLTKDTGLDSIDGLDETVLLKANAKNQEKTLWSFIKYIYWR